MKDLDKYIDKCKKIFLKYSEMATNHRFIILFIILGTAIAFALVKTQTYIDISRNNDRYIAETSKIKYSQINEETLRSFPPKITDTNIEVNSQFSPTRNNPFVDVVE